jgi:hypothetical protein
VPLLSTRSNGGFNTGMVSSRWERRMYIANECRTAKVVSMEYNGTSVAVQQLAHEYPGSVMAIDDAIYATTTDGTTNSTAFIEVLPLSVFKDPHASLRVKPQCMITTAACSWAALSGCMYALFTALVDTHHSCL